jgi:hypothetical protein
MLEETTEMEIRLDIQSVACVSDMEMLSIGHLHLVSLWQRRDAGVVGGVLKQIFQLSPSKASG